MIKLNCGSDIMNKFLVNVTEKIDKLYKIYEE